MKKSSITALLAGGCVVLAALAGVCIFTQDREAPVIRLEGKNDLTYTEGTDVSVLLEGISASDAQDGDVTDSVRIAKIYASGEDTATVVYVAKDSENNMGKLKREVRYVPAETEEETEDDKETDEEDTQEPSEQDDADDASDDDQDTSEGPKLTMIQSETTIKVGESFNVLRFVESAVDTDGSDLSRYLHIDGDYNLAEAGTYEIRVYATNTRGETSNVETFTLTVEP